MMRQIAHKRVNLKGAVLALSLLVLVGCSKNDKVVYQDSQAARSSQKAASKAGLAAKQAESASESASNAKEVSKKKAASKAVSKEKEKQAASTAEKQSVDEDSSKDTGRNRPVEADKEASLKAKETREIIAQVLGITVSELDKYTDAQILEARQHSEAVGGDPGVSYQYLKENF